jgi:uncharacterized protein YyaL (SSP411 family)
MHAMEAIEVRRNRLASEKSPYLRQHATNPVDWYPWSEAAFERSRQEGKPIFLSIGYSTCHWCHVMERESFTDPATAALLNANFVCIKVDREERPDVDRFYMSYVLATTGRGGWPMSVWLTPQLKPFFGGMYFPPERRGGNRSFKEVIAEVSQRWKTERDAVLAEADRALLSLTAANQTTAANGDLVVNDLWAKALDEAWRSFDHRRGGFGGAPKFPNPVMLGFLLDASSTSADRTQRERAEKMAVKTLEAMVGGGIHDQLGGGFHRYSVDARWHVPHFEKMLYDQAQIASVCLSAWQVSGSPRLRTAAIDTLQYVRRHLTDSSGGFYSAEDADSATPENAAVRREGAFYVWAAQEIETLLSPDEARLVAFVYGINRRGNVAADENGELAGKNVLFRAHSIDEAATKLRLSSSAAEQLMHQASTKLLAARELRPRPPRDTKMITAWNGLMISSFARAAQILDEPSYADIATQAADAIRNRLFNPATGRLSRSSRDNIRDELGFAEDYACLIQGLLDLYEATFQVRWLAWAVQLQEKQIELFADAAGGGFFANMAEDKTVLLRMKEDNEGAEPSASSVSVRNLLRLSELFQREDWRLLANRTAQSFHVQLKRDPLSMPQMLASIGLLEGSLKLVLVHGENSALQTTALMREINSHFLPRRALMRVDSESRTYFEERLEFVRELPPNRPLAATVYVCENYVCQLPTSDPAALAKQLEVEASRRDALEE